jgi:hypothetical protein
MAAPTSTPNPSRRATLCVLAGAPLAAIVGVPPALVAADPIFAVIERHKVAEAAFAATLGLIDEVRASEEGREVTQANRDTYEAADQASEDILAELLAGVPVSTAGFRAALEYIINLDDGYHLAAFAPTLLKSPLLAA